MSIKMSLTASLVAICLSLPGTALAAKNENQGSKKETPAEDKIMVCHKMKKAEQDCFPIEVSGNSLAGHLAHGDSVATPPPPPPPGPVPSPE